MFQLIIAKNNDNIEISHTRNHCINFHNSLDCNESRGFEIIVVLIYSEGIRDDLKKVKPSDYKETIKKLQKNNFGSMEVFKIDIDPTQKLQKLSIVSKNNIIECIIFSNSSNYEKQDSTKLILGQKFLNSEININCQKYGIYFREI